MRDYPHASDLFVTDNFAKVPKHSFLYSVYIDTIAKKDAVVGALAKQVSLPKVSFDEKALNAYNRTRIVQTRAHYDPVNITFHDDCSDIIRKFLFDYYTYYYADADNSTDPGDNIEPIKFNWGYRGRARPYINNIRITSLFHGKISEYTLINPIIKNFQPSDHQASETGGMMQHQITVDYEYFLLRGGPLSAENAPGFTPGQEGTQRQSSPGDTYVGGYSEATADPSQRRIDQDQGQQGVDAVNRLRNSANGPVPSYANFGTLAKSNPFSPIRIPAINESGSVFKDTVVPGGNFDSYINTSNQAPEMPQNLAPAATRAATNNEVRSSVIVAGIDNNQGSAR